MEVGNVWRWVMCGIVWRWIMCGGGRCAEVSEYGDGWCVEVGMCVPGRCHIVSN